jgi:hypothetical protein
MKVTSFVTAIGVLIAAIQIWLTKRIAVSQFEDGFVKEYRSVAAKLPTRALLGEKLTEHELDGHMDEMFQYFDLCNEQIFLRQIKRIQPKTWVFWRDGMKRHFSKPAFSQAWQRIECKRLPEFEELSRMIKCKFSEDPAKWKKSKTFSSIAVNS